MAGALEVMSREDSGQINVSFFGGTSTEGAPSTSCSWTRRLLLVATLFFVVAFVVIGVKVYRGSRGDTKVYRGSRGDTKVYRGSDGDTKATVEGVLVLREQRSRYFWVTLEEFSGDLTDEAVLLFLDGQKVGDLYVTKTPMGAIESAVVLKASWQDATVMIGQRTVKPKLVRFLFAVQRNLEVLKGKELEVLQGQFLAAASVDTSQIALKDSGDFLHVKLGDGKLNVEFEDRELFTESYDELVDIKRRISPSVELEVGVLVKRHFEAKSGGKVIMKPGKQPWTEVTLQASGEMSEDDVKKARLVLFSGFQCARTGSGWKFHSDSTYINIFRAAVVLVGNVRFRPTFSFEFSEVCFGRLPTKWWMVEHNLFFAFPSGSKTIAIPSSMDSLTAAVNGRHGQLVLTFEENEPESSYTADVVVEFEHENFCVKVPVNIRKEYEEIGEGSKMEVLFDEKEGEGDNNEEGETDEEEGEEDYNEEGETDEEEVEEGSYEESQSDEAEFARQIASFEEMLDTKTPSTKLYALNQLHALAKDGRKPTRTDLIREQLNVDSLRASALQVLAFCGDETDLEKIRQFAGGPENVQAEALFALGMLAERGSKQDLQAIRECTTDFEERVRYFAFKALGKVSDGSKEDKNCMQQGEKDTSEKVRQKARKALKKVFPDDSPPEAGASE